MNQEQIGGFNFGGGPNPPNNAYGGQTPGQYYPPTQYPNPGQYPPQTQYQNPGQYPPQGQYPPGQYPQYQAAPGQQYYPPGQYGAGSLPAQYPGYPQNGAGAPMTSLPPAQSPYPYTSPAPTPGAYGTPTPGVAPTTPALAQTAGTGFITLEFSKDSMHNSKLTGPGIQYELSTPSSLSSSPYITTVHRVDPKSQAKFVVGEIHWHTFSANKIRLGGGRNGEDWMPEKKFLKKVKSESKSRTFTGAHGVELRWDAPKSEDLTLHRAADDSKLQATLASYKTSEKSFWSGREKQPAKLEVTPQVLDSLDVIIVSFLVMEQNSRDTEAYEEGVQAGMGG